MPIKAIATTIITKSLINLVAETIIGCLTKGLYLTLGLQ